MRLAPFTGVYGLSFVFAMMSAALALAVLRTAARGTAVAGAAAAAAPAAALPAAQRGQRHRAADCSRTSPRPRSGRAESLDQMERDQVLLTLRGALAASRAAALDHRVAGGAGAVLLLRGPARSAATSTSWRAPRSAYLLIGMVAHTPTGAPLNSAVLVSPAGRPGEPLRQGEPGAVRRICALAVRLRATRSRPRSAISRRARAWWSRRWATTRSARSSATNRCSRTSCASSRPAAPKCCSTSRTTAGSARAPRASST